MSFVNRTYPDIVRDILTNLTQGVTQEVHHVSYDPAKVPVQIPDIVLKRRPVRRVSLVSGSIASPTAGELPLPYTFTLNDYALVPDPQDPEDLSRLRFLPFGKKPAPDTDVVVNYYPRNTDPTPITDLNVGSVARTVVEAISKELALLYAQMNLAYDAAFLETAQGSSLDRVVALLGYQRFLAGRPVGTVTFSRRAGALGNITIPAGTPITDTSDKVRYETVEPYDMLAGETTAQVRVQGATAAIPPVAAGVLTVIQKAIAGLGTVTNERPTTRANEDESDPELRARAKDALLASNKGTVPAIIHGLLQMPQVKDVKVVEMPNGVPGEIKVLISLADPAASPGGLPPEVLERLEELRPAGIRVLSDTAGSVALAAQVQLVLAGSHLAAAEVGQVQEGVKKTLIEAMARKGVGETIRVKPLVAALLADQRIVDATLTLIPKGAQGTPGADFQPEAGVTVQLAPEDISFGAETYDQPLPPAGQAIPVEVQAELKIQVSTGVSLDQAKARITDLLKTFFGKVTPGTAVDAAALLTALRDDAKYGLDPLGLKVTLTAEDQFAQILQGGTAFTVQPRQVFSVTAVEVKV